MPVGSMPVGRMPVDSMPVGRMMVHVRIYLDGSIDYRGESLQVG